ncbi:MAG: hypothetical protein ACRD36_09135 [Candidatus Acidiferrum sp.]
MKSLARNLKLKRSFGFGIVAIFLFAALGFGAQKKGGAAAGASVLAVDKGKLTIKLDGQTVGHEEFEISPAGGGWMAKGTTDIKAPEAAPTKITGTLVLQPDGAPVSYDWTSQADKTNGAHILFVNGVAKITLEMQGARPFEQDLSFGAPLIAVLDNNLYHQYAVLARLYDWNKRGAQSFPVLIPQELTPGSITVESTGSASADGKSYEGLKVTTSDLEVLLLLDSNHRLMRLEVPAAKVSVIRE